MKEKVFKGVFSALYSAYDNEMNVKEDTVRGMMDYQLKNGLNGFYVCGNTGECSVLPEKTRRQMLEAAVKFNCDRGLIMAHVGATHFDETKGCLNTQTSRK